MITTKVEPTLWGYPVLGIIGYLASAIMGLILNYINSNNYNVRGRNNEEQMALKKKTQEEDLKSHLLKVRQINIEGIKIILNPTKADLISQYLLKDMEKVVSKINKANSQLICIYGDYDVDGISSVSILLKTFNFLGINSIFYIPKRMRGL